MPFFEVDANRGHLLPIGGLAGLKSNSLKLAVKLVMRHRLVEVLRGNVQREGFVHPRLGGSGRLPER